MTRFLTLDQSLGDYEVLILDLGIISTGY